MARHGVLPTRQRSVGFSILGVIGEILLTLAAVCALYIAWQLWWTGVVAERTQMETRQTVSWSDPASSGSGTQVAQPQQGDPPVQPSVVTDGSLVAQLYIPRFGLNWQRNIVEGISAEQLAKHGLGHYPTSQLPGQIGNFAIAGHRGGYGEPLAYVDQLQEGDPIIIRTQDYWYVYRYTKYKITVPEDVAVVSPDPFNVGATPTHRYITLTTCEPRYSPTPATHRWISWGELDYWAKVSDGVPKELAATDSSGQVKFAVQETPSVFARVSSLTDVLMWVMIAYVVIYLAALVAWRYPALRSIREGERPRPDASLYGWLLRRQPGPVVIQLLLVAILAFAGAVALFQWAFPWLASNVPMFQLMSAYVSVE
ncbi:class E sortase [Bifidobacterium avesanii]|uniref:Class E sortase n=1 Tax=Bifidobacterium avesanii TaxID=1798157 RepID=A0A7K3TIJ0_9BIFI|nr:class E sortase [Bifidobacterium avesanii]KAB8290127.1 Sortase family protein [Bifidobacterium avesanii]NEG78925.1 class E sortase [Bifidobacterium avesanii]